MTMLLRFRNPNLTYGFKSVLSDYFNHNAIKPLNLTCITRKGIARVCREFYGACLCLIDCIEHTNGR